GGGGLTRGGRTPRPPAPRRQDLRGAGRRRPQRPVQRLNVSPLGNHTSGARPAGSSIVSRKARKDARGGPRPQRRDAEICAGAEQRQVRLFAALELRCTHPAACGGGGEWLCSTHSCSTFYFSC